MAIDTMKKGSIEMLTLFLLCEEDAYGYQLVQKIKERSKGLITVQEGSFYPLLYRLADDGVHHRRGGRNAHEHGAFPHACDLSYRKCRA